ncbi:MAG: DNA polymerase III subunit delta [Clostridia bacterium]|nr:DNA polymerase III subunit delta [Clostridia bacterium]
MKFIELNKNLKQEIKPLYNLKGEDFFLIKQALTNIKALIIKDLEEFNFIKLDAEKLKKEQAYEQIATLPIGNDYRLVVLENPSQDIVKFLNKYSFEDNFTVVVCVNADNLTAGELVDCAKMERADISKYILNSLAKSNLSIEEQALDFLIEATNSNMTKIVNELNKITAYCVDLKVVTMDIVTNLVASSDEYAIFMLTGAIDSKDYSKYQQILNQMSKAQTHNEIFSYMGKYFKRMQYISLNKNDEEIAKILNIKPYAVKMSRQFIAKNGIKYYINLYQKYIDLDHKIKSGKITATNALYELVF